MSGYYSDGRGRGQQKRGNSSAQRGSYSSGNGRRNTYYEEGENRCQRSVNTACFSTDKLCDIRILLLRHDTAACAVCVIDLNETVLIGIPQNDLL